MMSPGITYIDVYSPCERVKYKDESEWKENVKFPSFVSLAVKIESVDSNSIISETGLMICPEIWISFKSFFDMFKHPIKNKVERRNEKWNYALLSLIIY